MNIGTGEEATFRDGCLSLRAATIAKIRASQSPGFAGQVPNGIGRQPLSRFRTEPVIGWAHLTEGLHDKGRPVETQTGKNTPGPQYQLDRLTYGQQVQSRFKTAPTPVFGTSQRLPLNDEVVSPGPMTAAVNVNGQPAGPKYSMAGAPWRKEKTTEGKSPGPGQYTMYGALGEQKESTRVSFKGFGFGGSGVTRDMALPTRNVPGPGAYAWHEKDRSPQGGVTFGSSSQRPSQRQETRPGPCQYIIPSTMGTTADSRFRTVVAPGFGTPSSKKRPQSASGRLQPEGPGPGAYDVQRVDDIAIAKRPLSTDKSCQFFQIRPPTSMPRTAGSSRERKLQELDPESIRRAVLLTRKGRVPGVSFGVGPQRPVENPDKCPGPQAYDPANLRRAVAASRSSPTRGVKFGTGPQRYNIGESDKSPGPNASYAVQSTMGSQSNSMFRSVNAPSFGNPPPKGASRTKHGSDGPGPCAYNPSLSNMPQTTHGITFGGGNTSGKRVELARGVRRGSTAPGPGAYQIGSGLGSQASSKYKSSPAPSFRAR